jgi:glycosyltransferase involved in cell wall biosynthesis
VKILIGHDTYPPDVNGAARFTERLAIGLLGRGHQVHVIAPSTTGRPFVEEQDGIVVHRLPSHRYPLAPQFRICLPWEIGRRIDRILDEVRPDVIHIQGHFLITRLLATRARARGIPLVATNHFMPENLADHVRMPRQVQVAVSRAAWRDCAGVLGKAQVITAPTPRAVELLASSAGLPGGVAISCGIDASRYERATSRAAARTIPNVLFVGRLDQEKRVDELIRAFAQLPADLPARLEIVGDGVHREEWRALADKVGIADRTVFHGFISEEDLLAAYGRCDVFVMPGVAELQSLVTLESMAAGKPVIAANAMALPHLVRPGRNGFLFEPGNVGELAGSLVTLLRDPGLRARMGRESRAIAAGHALDTTLDRFEGIYADVTGRIVPLGRAA